MSQDNNKRLSMQQNAQNGQFPLPKIEQKQRQSKQGNIDYNFTQQKGEGNQLRKSQNDIKSLMNSSKSTFIKEFSDKLDKHQFEIDQRNKIISEMERNIEFLKSEYLKEKKKGSEKDQLISELQETRQQNQLKIKNLNLKIEEMSTQLLHYEKEINNLKNLDKSDQLSQLYDQIKDKDNLIQNLQGLIKEKSDAYQLLQNELNEFKQKNLSLQNESDKFSSEIKKKDIKDDKINQLEKEIQKLKDQLNSSNDKQIKQEILDELNQKIKSLNSNILEQKQQLDDKNKLISEKENEIQKVNQQKKQEIQEINKQMENLGSELIQLKKLNKEMQDQIQTLKNENMSLQNSQRELEMLKEKLKENNELIKKNIQTLEQNETEIKKSLKCNFCNKLICEPVTIIPCGHNYCLNCKQAYQKQCSKCGPKVKIEAMYRNELLDDILGMMKIMESTREVLKKLSK